MLNRETHQPIPAPRPPGSRTLVTKFSSFVDYRFFFPLCAEYVGASILQQSHLVAT